MRGYRDFFDVSIHELIVLAALIVLNLTLRGWI
jgi:hypothetical protein